MNCQRCKIDEKKRHLHCPDDITEAWLCEECRDLFEIKFEEFKNNFIHRERSKREDVEGPSHLPNNGWPEKNSGFP